MEAYIKWPASLEGVGSTRTGLWGNHTTSHDRGGSPADRSVDGHGANRQGRSKHHSHAHAFLPSRRRRGIHTPQALGQRANGSTGGAGPTPLGMKKKGATGAPPRSNTVNSFGQHHRACSPFAIQHRQFLRAAPPRMLPVPTRRPFPKPSHVMPTPPPAQDSPALQARPSTRRIHLSSVD